MKLRNYVFSHCYSFILCDYLFFKFFKLNIFSRIFLKSFVFSIICSSPLLLQLTSLRDLVNCVSVNTFPAERQNMICNFHANGKIIAGNKSVVLLLNETISLPLCILFFYCSNWREVLGRRQQTNYGFSCLKKTQSFLHLENWALVWI